MKKLIFVGFVALTFGLSFFNFASATLPPTVYFIVSANDVPYNEGTDIFWYPNHATSCVGTGGSNGWAGTKNYYSDGFYTGKLTQTTTYTITCSNSMGSATASTTIHVGPAPFNSPTLNLTVSPDNISYGAFTNISWYSHNATSCNASGGTNNWTGAKNLTGSFNTGALYGTTTYTLTCTNNNASETKSVTVNVSGQVINAPTISIYATPTNVSYGNSTNIYWNTSNANSCNATNGTNNWAGSKNTSGNFSTGALYGNTTFTLTCTNSGGSSTNSVMVTVDQQIDQNPTVSTSYATNIGANSATLNGTVNSNSNSYVMAWFEWGPNGNLYNQTTKNTYSGNVNTSFNYTLGGLATNTIYYFRAVAQGANGTMVYGNQMTFTTTNDNTCYGCYNYNSPNVTTYGATGITENYATLNGYVDPNGTYTTRWFEYGTSSGNLYNTTNKIAQGTSAGNFNQYVSGLTNNTVYYFRAVAQNSNGTRYGNILTFTTNTGNIYYNTCSNYGSSCIPTAVTTVASNVGQTSARLNGLGLVNGNVSTNGYFEWGTTMALGNTTTSGFIGNISSSPFYSNINGLSVNTTYYFRAVVQNQYGTSRGDILTFSTLAGSTSTTTTNTNIVYRDRVVVTNVIDEKTVNTDTSGTSTSKPSLVFLSITGNNEVVKKGNTLNYVVTYKNVSAKNLKDVVLRVSIPKELEFIETTKGVFSTENNMVVVNIETLSPQEEGSVLVKVKVNTSADTGKIIVVTANLAYTVVADDTQEEVFAYSKNTIGEKGESTGGSSALTGIAIFGSGFLPSTLAGWLIVLLIILVVILFFKMTYINASKNKQNIPPPPIMPMRRSSIVEQPKGDAPPHIIN